ncbi:hypothetical protein HK098_005538, partial [Nowakowskiella sp. JEL0407]
MEAAILFAENIYTLLTDKRVHRSHLLTEKLSEEVPHFALPTTSTMIRCIAETPEK